MTKRFQYIRGKYKHGIQDIIKDGEYKKGYRCTYDDFDLEKLAKELNIRENRINQLLKENVQLKKRISDLEIENEAQSDAIDGLHDLLAHEDLDELMGND